MATTQSALAGDQLATASVFIEAESALGSLSIAPGVMLKSYTIYSTASLPEKMAPSIEARYFYLV